MDIEKRIKEEAESYPIHTTSKDILSMYQEKKKKRFPYWIPVTGLALTSLIVTLICINLPKPDTPQSDVSVTPIVEKEVSLEDDTLLSQAGLQLFFSTQLESSGNRNLRQRQLPNIDSVIQEAKEKKEERIKENYTSLFSLQNSFFKTEDHISYTYGKTEYYYKNEKYNYVLIEGDSKIYTKDDIEKDLSLSKAVYVLKGNIYQGSILVKNEEESLDLVTTFENEDKAITILKGEDEDGSGLFYQVSDKDDKEHKPSEFYKISTQFGKEGDDVDRVDIIHSTTKNLLKATTRKGKTQYDVDYFDMQYTPFSLIKEEFSFTLNEEGEIQYQFDK